ncbi:MAG: hypothetical protein HY077_09815 [Elusimicrobia bacterium]|nr:hypothetical protein [Elusimicrobiota bacterium]
MLESSINLAIKSAIILGLFAPLIYFSRSNVLKWNSLQGSKEDQKRREYLFGFLIITSPFLLSVLAILFMALSRSAPLEPHDFVRAPFLLLIVTSGVVLVWRVSNLSFYPKLAGRLLGGFAAVAGGFLLQLESCSLMTIRSHSIWSPDGLHAARVTEFDAGAADDFHTSVDVRSRGALRSTAVFSSESHPLWVHPQWTDNSHLLILYPYEAREMSHQAKCDGHVDGIEISCQFIYPNDEPRRGNPDFTYTIASSRIPGWRASHENHQAECLDRNSRVIKTIKARDIVVSGDRHYAGAVTGSSHFFTLYDQSCKPLWSKPFVNTISGLSAEAISMDGNRLILGFYDEIRTRPFSHKNCRTDVLDRQGRLVWRVDQKASCVGYLTYLSGNGRFGYSDWGNSLLVFNVDKKITKPIFPSGREYRSKRIISDDGTLRFEDDGKIIREIPIFP